MDTVEQVHGYFYKGYWNLKPDELYMLIMVDVMSQHLGITASAAAMLLSGQPWVSTRTKPAGALEGTSVASKYSRMIFRDKHLPVGIRIPTPIGGFKNFRFTPTNKVGTIIGRYIPWVGLGMAVWTARAITKDTADIFNTIVAPKDRIQWTYF
ncbi:MAG: cytoplasmic protein [Proteobacteria bacterium]|nr:cytoplasmic protein [Pseudomonadota bacterium]